MDDNEKGLFYLFERPFELLEAPRANGMIQFQQTDEEDEAGTITHNDSGVLVLNFKKLDNILDEMEMVKKVPKGVPYSHFDHVHRGAATELTTLFMEYVDKPDYWAYACAIKESVNEGLFIFSLSCVIIRAPNINSRLVPAISECFPNMFISQYTIDKCKEKVKELGTKDAEIVIDVDKDFTGTHESLEHRLPYWREDYGMNAHHWHWHLVFNDITWAGIECRDRMGEVFYYMHNQMLGRYDWERLSNGLSPVVPLENWHEPIPDGYFPDLAFNNTSSHYGSRPDNMSLRKDRISELEKFKHRFQIAIEKRCMINENQEHIPLTDDMVPWEESVDGKIKKHKRGIDILGDALEPSNESVDRDHYGGLHNAGHNFIGRIHNPPKKSFDRGGGPHKANFGVMRYTATAMRDPVFYRWHKFIDNIFQDYKMQQEPYEDEQLLFDQVQLESVSVKSGELDDNVLETGWTYDKIEVSRGLDFGRPSKPVEVRTQHLTHYKFVYNLEVTNNNTEPLEVTVRLYMAPMFNEKGEPMTYKDQRQLWAEMDRYKETLDPGFNSLERKSTDSSITIPKAKTFRDLENDETLFRGDPEAFCGCGWPQHLLLPKGKIEGMDFQIFALISCWDEDKVVGSDGENACSNAASYCGILNKKYPDARPMGYPFDRSLRSPRRPNETPTVNDTEIENATDFATALPNAAMCDIKINFLNKDLFPVPE